MSPDSFSLFKLGDYILFEEVINSTIYSAGVSLTTFISTLSPSFPFKTVAEVVPFLSIIVTMAP